MTENLSPVDRATRNRNRWALVAIAALFFGALMFAGLLRFSGWRPAGMKNMGELLQPPADLRQVVPTQFDGKDYKWSDAPRTWRILAMTHDCDGARRAACESLLEQLDKVWQLSGKDADRPSWRPAWTTCGPATPWSCPAWTGCPGPWPT